MIDLKSQKAIKITSLDAKKAVRMGVIIIILFEKIKSCFINYHTTELITA